EFDETAAPSRGAVDVGIVRHRSWDVGRTTLGCLVVAPQEFAGLGLHAHEALIQKLDVLLEAANFDDYGRRKRGLIAARHGPPPNDVACLLVQRQQSGLAAPGRADEQLTVDER